MCVFDYTQIYERLMRDALGNVSLKREINPLKAEAEYKQPPLHGLFRVRTDKKHMAEYGLSDTGLYYRHTRTACTPLNHVFKTWTAGDADGGLDQQQISSWLFSQRHCSTCAGRRGQQGT